MSVINAPAIRFVALSSYLLFMCFMDDGSGAERSASAHKHTHTAVVLRVWPENEFDKMMMSIATFMCTYCKFVMQFSNFFSKTSN